MNTTLSKGLGNLDNHNFKEVWQKQEQLRTQTTRMNSTKILATFRNGTDLEDSERQEKTTGITWATKETTIWAKRTLMHNKNSGTKQLVEEVGKLDVSVNFTKKQRKSTNNRYLKSLMTSLTSVMASM
jgi:hypothetical protein